MSKWLAFPENKPENGNYVVYIDRAASNNVDTVAITSYEDGRWRAAKDDVITHFRKRPKPPEGSWMEKQGRR